MIAACTEGVKLGEAAAGNFYDIFEVDVVDGFKVGEETKVQYVGAVGMITISFSARTAVITFTTY